MQILTISRSQNPQKTSCFQRFQKEVWQTVNSVIVINFITIESHTVVLFVTKALRKIS